MTGPASPWRASGAGGVRWAKPPIVKPSACSLPPTRAVATAHGSRLRLWKLELQQLADESGLEIAVCHLPPGTSKWNKIEHRLFSFISQNWRGKPLVSHEVIVNLISATTTRAGLKVRAKLDTNAYPAGVKVSDKQVAGLQMSPDSFHGEWNYTIHPNRRIT
jgi:Rhodopirellula transposase DDE domain